VSVQPDSQVNTFGALTSAMNNWNNALVAYCYAPLLTFGAGTGSIQTVAYGPLPAPAGSTTQKRGNNILNISGRIISAAMTINSNIPLTFPNVMTDVIAHEIGHTMGLNDCIYSGATPNPCPLYSTVMEDQAPVPEWTATMGQPGPTTCDLGVMIGVATDYACPPAPPPCDPNVCANPPIGMDLSSCGCPNSPVILDLSGRGFQLTSAANGVMFDISGTGHPVRIGWTASDANNAFLALPGADGLVHNGKQLFGNYASQPASATRNGFAALAVYDDPENGGNGDGIIDARDAIFSSLRLWIDANHDGISQPEELHTLPSLGVNSISLTYKADQRTDQWGNVFHYRAQVNPGNATSTGRMAYDVFFVVEPAPTAKNNLNPAGGKCQVPTIKVGMLAAGVGR